MIFNRYEECFGITLWSIGKYRAEIWFCAPGYKIREHSHSQEDVELVHIYGDTIFHRRNLWNNVRESVVPRFLQKFTVKHFHAHHFSVGKRWLVFLNLQTFRNGYKPVSAAKDFTLTK